MTLGDRMERRNANIDNLGVKLYILVYIGAMTVANRYKPLPLSSFLKQYFFCCQSCQYDSVILTF